jgi:hypothetical protein
MNNISIGSVFISSANEQFSSSTSVNFVAETMTLTVKPYSCRITVKPYSCRVTVKS